MLSFLVHPILAAQGQIFLKQCFHPSGATLAIQVAAAPLVVG